MRLYGLIGYPLSHSFSQKYFTEKFLRKNIRDCRYVNFPIRPISEITTVLKDNPQLAGLNITIPYKEKIIEYLDGADEIVQKTNACNCIKIQNGKLIGYNTDVAGFEKSFKEKLQPVHNRALILGTGGASKAVQFVFRKLGIPFTLVSRTPVKSGLTYHDITPAIIQQYLIIVNTTPLGMQPNIDLCPSLPYLALSNKHYLYDLVYNPEKTVFLENGEKQGSVIKNGYEMLVYQAEECWRIWNE